MIPRIVIYYVRSENEKRPGEKIAKSAFVNDTDALLFWNALSETRKRYLQMETIDGEIITEIAHTGWTDFGGGYYGHAYALTESSPLPSRERSRESAIKYGWEFEKIGGG